jgi:hypothetical protein
MQVFIVTFYNADTGAQCLYFRQKSRCSVDAVFGRRPKMIGGWVGKDAQGPRVEEGGAGESARMQKPAFDQESYGSL